MMLMLQLFKLLVQNKSNPEEQKLILNSKQTLMLYFPYLITDNLTFFIRFIQSELIERYELNAKQRHRSKMSKEAKYQLSLPSRRSLREVIPSTLFIFLNNRITVERETITTTTTTNYEKLTGYICHQLKKQNKINFLTKGRKRTSLVIVWGTWAYKSPNSVSFTK